MLLILVLMARACNFKGSQATIHKNLLSMGQFIKIFIRELCLPMMLYGTSAITLVSLGINARYGNSYVVEAYSFMYINYFCGVFYLVILGLFWFDLNCWMR